MLKRISIILSGLLILLVSGCEVKNGTIANEIEIPLDNKLVLYGENEGIHPNRDILDNPENPYANAGLNQENVWDIYEDCPSPKAKFYLWGTMLTIIPMGEHQYYTALSLHELYTVGGSENARKQAIKAYRAVLDHYFDSTTWYLAWWVGEETYYPVHIKHIVGQNLYDPSPNNLLPLFNQPVFAAEAMGEWGYVYNPDTKEISKWH
jgi:hypothetical protein